MDCAFEAVPVTTARWVTFKNPGDESEFRRRNDQNLALDGHDSLSYIAPNRANLQLAIERWPDVEFRATREL